MIRGKKGFTLIELIVVVIIVGILAAVAVPMFSNMRAKAIATEAVMGVSAMRQAVRNYSVGVADNQGIVIDFSLNLYYPPGVAASINPSDFNGTYFSKECYSGAKTVHGTLTNLQGKCNFNKNVPEAKKTITDSLKDNPDFDAYIDIDKKGKITQFNFSRSGYPET